MGFKVLTEQFISTATIEAGTAKLRIIGNDTLANLEVFDLGTDGGHHADRFMAWDEREFCNEFAFVDMQISTTNTTSLDLDLFERTN